MSKPISNRSIPANRRHNWLGGASKIAASIALATVPAGQANAQSISIGPRINATVAAQGTPVVESGGVTITRGAVTDQVQVNTTTAIINWSTLDTATLNTTSDYVNFLPEGTSLAFTGPGTEYAVLNRIFSAPDTNGDYRGIAFGGAVTSQLAIGGETGGTIWFYSPGGILISATATFNVGSLLLTTSAPDPAGLGTGAISLLGVTSPSSTITIDNGASINAAAASGSYIAMVAPRIVQNGSVSADGSIAYVAAEQATLTISNSLFDIAVSVGSEDANGVVHGDTGITTGPSSTGGADPQAIYLVSVPKNDAITMLVGGAIGYQAASAANIVNGNIVLTTSANVDVLGATPSIDMTASAGPGGNITVDGASFGSSVEIYADDTINLIAGSTLFDSLLAANSVGVQNLVATAGQTINVTATAAASVGATGDVILRAGTPENGGTINVNVDQLGFVDTVISGLLAGGNIVLDVSGAGLDDYATIRNNGGTGIGGDATGGTINVNVFGGGDIVAGGDMVMDASAQAGKGELKSGNATAGDISLSMSSGTINLGGRLFADSFAEAAEVGKPNLAEVALEGGDSVAGDIFIDISGGALTTGGTTFLRAYANGSDGSDSTITQSNDAIAGNIDLDITGGNHTVDFLFMNAAAAGGTSFDANGEGFAGAVGRGSIDLLLSGASTSLNVFSTLRMLAGTNGIVDAPTGDVVTISVEGTGSQGLSVSGLIDIETRAVNGSLATPTEAGSVSITAAGGYLGFGSLDVDASAGPDVGFKGSAFGGLDFIAGDVSLISSAGGQISGGTVSFNAAGLGAEGGDGAGGDISLIADDGVLSISEFVSIDASGKGGSPEGFSFGPNAPTDGSGGNLLVSVDGANGELQLGSFSFDNSGIGVSGGNGTAGSIQLDLTGGTFSAGTLDLTSNGIGGSSSGGGIILLGLGTLAALDPAPSGGVGQGGSVTFNLDGADVILGGLSVTANGIGGNGQPGDFNSNTSGGNGGDGIGGVATFNALSGSLIVDGTLTVEATGTGGNGGNGSGSAGGNGGNAIGGVATFNNDGTATVSAVDILVSAEAQGGAGGSSFSTFDNNSGFIPDAGGGRGGDATGGTAQFFDIAGQLDFSQLTVSADGYGGNGGNSIDDGGEVVVANAPGGDGGDGLGGTAEVVLERDDPNSFKTYNVYSIGLGGDGGDGGGSGSGGTGSGGSASLSIVDVTISIGGLQIDASGIGGGTGFNDAFVVTDGGAGGDAFGGSALFELDGVNAAIIMDSPQASILAEATGGNGGEGSNGDGFAANDGGNGGAGGAAQGGAAQIAAVNGASLSIAGFDFALSADAQGGDGGNGGGNFVDGIDGNGGVGGDAIGGEVSIFAGSGASIDLFSDGPFQLSSTGFGGNGGDGGVGATSGGTPGSGGDGGSGTGGAPSLIASGGSISSTEIDLIAEGIGGDGGTGSPLGPMGNGGMGIGGQPLIEISDSGPGQIDLGSTNIFADGTGGLGAVNGIAIGGLVTIHNASTNPASLMSFGSLNISALGDALDLTSGVLISNANATPISLSNLIVDTSGNIDSIGSAEAGGSITLDALGNISLASMESLDGSFFATAGGDISFDNAVAASALDFLAGGSITGGDAVGNPIDLAATGPILVDSATGFVNSIISSTGAVTVTTDLGDANQISGTSVSITDTNDVDVALIDATAGNIVVNASGDVTLGQMFATGNAAITSGGALTLTDFSFVENDAFLNSAGLLTIQDFILAGGNISITGQDDILFDTPGSGIAADGNVSINTSANLILQFGFIDGTVIDITARDVELAVGNGAGIGSSFQTQLVSFTNTVDPMVIGGAGTVGAFSISYDEILAIESGGSLVFNARALGGSTPDLVIEDVFAFVGNPNNEGSGQIGPAGALVFDSAGSMLVSGNLTLFGAEPATAIVLDATTLLRINAETGSVQIFDPNENLGGTIFISARDFMAVTDAAFADIPGLTLPQIDLRLANSDGVNNPGGIIRADTLNIDTTASQVFIQNTALGTDPADRRGFEVNNLNISDSGGTIQPIVINGTVGGATGADAISETNVFSSFYLQSTINGCLIISPGACRPSTSQPPTNIPHQPIECEVDPGECKKNNLPDSIESMLIELAPEGEYWDDPLIDEPVTGAGNEDLWTDPELCVDEDCPVEPAE